LTTTVRTPAPASGLRADARDLFDAVVMAVAGSAPAYSIAASTAALVAAAGFAGPASLLYCGIPMLGIAWAFSYLNRLETNAGASYAWVGRVLHPALGFLAGWALVVSATIFMVAASLPAGSVTLGLFSSSLADNAALVTLAGSGWFLAMITRRKGSRASAVDHVRDRGHDLAGIRRPRAGAHREPPHVPFSWSWLGLGHFRSLAGFAAGALVAAFYYWGWDVSSN
jgi:Amino acid permease